MYLWKRRADQRWANENGEELGTIAGKALAVIEQPGRKLLQLEVASNQRAELEKIWKRFGGGIEKLPRDWLKHALRHKTKPFKVGTKHLTIPAGAAFGTGEHATTAMSLWMVEKIIRFWEAHAPSRANASPARTDRALAIADFSARRRKEHARRVRSPDLVIDLGTGSGILALAARILGAKRVIAIDNDPIAISTAKQNARSNKVGGVEFRLTDVRRWKTPRDVDIVIANLFSELLIEILPKLRTARWFVLSGILRDQERDVRLALAGGAIDIIEVRRRGKWVAILAARS